jgi:hypothetical protein
MGKAFVVRPLPIVAASSADTAAGLPSYVANDYMGVVWTLIADGVQETITIDLGANRLFDTMMLFGVSFTGTGPPGNCAIDAAKDGDPTFAGAIMSHPFAVRAGITDPTSGRLVTLWTHPGTPDSYRYVRLRFAGFSAAFNLLSIGRVVLGERLQLDRGFAFGAGFGLRDFGQVDFSPQAVLLRRRAPKLRTVGLTFPSVHKDEVEAKVQPLIELAGNQEPIALCTDDAADAMRQRRCYFGPLLGDLGTVWARPNGFEWQARLIDLVPIPKAS